MNAYHEMDDHGNHRITVGGQTSEWVPYSSMPSLEVDGALYTAVSAYWDGTLPIESVLKVELVSKETRNYPGRGENPIRIKPGYSVIG